MRIGSNQKNTVLSPSSRWKDRFHRTGLLGELSIFVSRPTFDLLRRNDKKGTTTYEAIKDFVELIRDHGLEPVAERCLLNNLSGLRLDCGDYMLFAIGPFNVDTEMNKASNGLMIHLETDDEDRKASVEEINVRDHFHNLDAHKPLDEDGWDACREVFEKLYPTTQKDKINPDAYDLAAARLLPSEPLVNEDYNQTTFRQFLLRQFNEVRLHDDSNKVNVEQVRAIDMYDYSKSTLLNLSGRPGTGKSTILHILVCEALLQKGPLRGERRLLYLATTVELLREAKNEIRGLLEYVYKANLTIRKSCLDRIDFVTEEDLYTRAPSSSDASIQDRKALAKVLKQIRQGGAFTTHEQKWSYWTDEKNVDALQRILRNFVYGVFGSPSEFGNWIPKGKDDREIRKRFEQPFNLLRPFDEKLAKDTGSEDLTSDIDALYFWDPDFSDLKLAAKRVRDLCHLLEVSGGLRDYLIDLKLKKMTGLWDPSGLIYRDTDVSSFHNLAEDDEFKKRTQTTGWDGIFIDESQDFSIKTLSTLLSTFSNRGPHRKENFNPFTFVAVGDEYQTIRGTLFQGGMLHINKLITDWMKILVSESNDSMHTLSENLPLPQKKSLRANYRNFEQAVEAINKIVQLMREIAQKKGKKRAIKLNEYDVQRTGVIARIPTNASNDDNNIAGWEEALRILFGQLRNKFDQKKGEVDLKVSMIFPHEEFTSIQQIEDGLSRILEWGLNERIETIIRGMLEFIGHQREVAERETDLNEKRDGMLNVLGKLNEAGFMDIASIKGLTVPTVIALEPPTVQETEPWFVNMQALALSLVMISRPQFGLFIAASKKNFRTLTGIFEEYHSTLPGDLKFQDRLANASVPETPPERLLMLALNSWFNKRTWQRVIDLEHIPDAATAFAQWLKDIHIAIRNEEIETAMEHLELDGIFKDHQSNGKEIQQYLDASRFLDPRAITALRFFLSMQQTLRELSDRTGGVSANRLNDLKEQWVSIETAMGDPEITPALRPTIAKEANSLHWMMLIFGRQTNLPEGMKETPWDLETNISPSFENPIKGPNALGLPRLRISPWKLASPPGDENLELWMTEATRWTPSSKLLRRIVKEFVPRDKRENTLEKTEWFLNFLDNNAKAMVDASIESALSEKPDFRELHWLQSFCLEVGSKDVNPNKGLYLYDSLRSLLPSEIRENEKSSEAISRWIVSQTSGNSIIRCLKHIVLLSEEKAKQKIEILRHLDTKLILMHWLDTTNVSALHNLAPEIKFLMTVNSGGIESNVVQNLSRLIDFNSASKLEKANSDSGSNDLRDYARGSTGEKFANALFNLDISSDFENFADAGLHQSMTSFAMRLFASLLLRDSKTPDQVRSDTIASYLMKIASNPTPMSALKRQDAQVLGWYQNIRNPSDFPGAEVFTKVINSHKNSSHDRAFRSIMSSMKNGSFSDMQSMFLTGSAQCIRLHNRKENWPQKSELTMGIVDDWRKDGHNWNWLSLLGTGLSEVPSERFRSKSDIETISMNAQTFKAYLLLDHATREGDQGLVPLVEQHLIKGGALMELKALRMYKAFTNPESSLNALLNTYWDVLDLDRQMYLMHLDGEEELVSRISIDHVPRFIGSKVYENYGGEIGNSSDILPRKMPGEPGKRIYEAIEMCDDWLKPFFKNMNRHNMMRALAKAIEPDGVDLTSIVEVEEHLRSVEEQLPELTFQAYPDHIFKSPWDLYDVETFGRKNLRLRFTGGASSLTEPIRFEGLQSPFSREMATVIRFLRCRFEKDDEGLIQAICEAYGVPGFERILSQTPQNELDILLGDISLRLKEQGLPESLRQNLLKAIRNNGLDESDCYILEDKLGSLELVNKAIDLVVNA